LRQNNAQELLFVVIFLKVIIDYKLKVLLWDIKAGKEKAPNVFEAEGSSHSLSARGPFRKNRLIKAMKTLGRKHCLKRWLF